MTFPRVSEIRFHRAADQDVGTGLLAYVSFLLDGRIRLDGVTVRRTRDGDLTLVFPERRDSAGRRHPLVRPLDNETRRAIEQQVFAALQPTSEESR